LSLIEKKINVDLLHWKDELILSQNAGKTFVFDPIRKKKIQLQPEELVRQLMIHWFLKKSNFNRNNIQVEKLITIHQLKRRFDIVVYDKNINPYILIECKAPDVRIAQATFDQIAVYNMALSAPYLMVTNGLETYCAMMDHLHKSYIFMDDIPIT
jgi:hypothetical protein